MSGICDTCKRKECYMQHDGDDSCPLYLKGRQSNYKRLFGTPENVARTLVAMYLACNGCGCDYCPLGRCCPNTDEYDELFEWLKGEEE